MWDRANVFGNSEEVASDTVTTGTPLSEPPLIDMMSNDPVLRGVKVLLLYLSIYIYLYFLDKLFNGLFGS